MIGDQFSLSIDKESIFNRLSGHDCIKEGVCVCVGRTLHQHGVVTMEGGLGCDRSSVMTSVDV